MPIHLITGIPGHGKTARMVKMLLDEAAKESPRPLFAAGIDGLKPGIATVINDPAHWNAEDPNGEPTCDCHQNGRLHAHVIPDGSMIYIDEAWKWFGHLSNPSRQQTPGHVLSLAEHRHRGLDFVMTSQGPNQLYPFMRPLVAPHEHVVRKFGTQAIDVYRWGELVEDVKSQGNRDRSLHSVETLPVKAFGSYKSASEHTIRAQIPWKLWLIPVTAVAGAVLAWYAWQALSPDAMAENLTGKPASGVAAAGSPLGASPRSSEAESPLTDAEWLDRLEPRFPGLHASAVAFDDRPILAVPRRFCVVTQIESGERCRCFTEQVTPLSVPRAECLHVARWGEYDAFRAPPVVGTATEVFQPDRPAIENAAPLGSSAGPSSIGSPDQGQIWGRAPDTLSASGG